MIFSAINRNILARTSRKLAPLVKKSKTASYFTITLSLFSLSFFGLFAIRPTLITAVSLIKSVSDLQKLNIDYENKISNIIRAQAEYEKIRDNLSLIYDSLPDNANSDKLAKSLESIADKYNLTINQLQIDPSPISKSTSSNQAKNFGFTLVVYGKYQDLYQFLNHLVTGKRIITIKSFEISQDPNNQIDNLRLSIKGNSYYES